MFMIHWKMENTISHLHYISGACYLKRIAFNKSFDYTVPVRGYHYFKPIWQSKEYELLIYQFENGNSYDMFVIKTCDQRGTMVYYLLHEISRIRKFIIDHDATVPVCLPKHIVYHLLSRMGCRSHAKYQFPYAEPA